MLDFAVYIHCMPSCFLRQLYKRLEISNDIFRIVGLRYTQLVIRSIYMCIVYVVCYSTL